VALAPRFRSRRFLFGSAAAHQEAGNNRNQRGNVEREQSEADEGGVIGEAIGDDARSEQNADANE
jgi:hypothetical protein